MEGHTIYNRLRIFLILSVAILSTPALIHAQMMPLPAHATAGSGSLLIEHGIDIVLDGYTEPRLERARDRFLVRLTQETAIIPAPPNPGPHAKLTIKTAGPGAPVQQLGEDESYHLVVSPAGATLSAANPLGVLRGLQTLLQLIQATPQGFSIPATTIDDAPRFPWRGLMIDAGRHFMPLSVIRQTLDGMEAVKMNVLHWHLSEDQGFRIESNTFPFLQQKGSDGLYYTQEEVRGILDYARDRGIRVVPEFDMPGHASSWFVGYPDLASGPGPYRIQREWGVFDPAMDPTRDSTYNFLDKFISEMTALFPDAYFHIGGDECNGKEWDRNPRIQQYMHEHNIKNNAALQAYFTGRVKKLVTAHGKITVGWDEVLQPETPKDVVIQSWRGQESLAQAAQRGNRGILSTGYYIDLNQPASQHYAVDPLEGATAKLTPEQQKNILGGEATMWSEYVSPENVASRIWPRTAAIAERLWSPQNTKDVQSMYDRLAIESRRLASYGLDYQATGEKMIQRIAGTADPAPFKALASVVEPPKEYDREELQKNYSYTPLNHLVDAVSPESDVARQFRNIASRIAAQSATKADHEQARQWLTLWRDNDARLQPTLSQSSLTSELAPASRNLSETATIGLAALDALETSGSTNTEKESQLVRLKTLKAPQAVLLDMIVPGVETLVNATRH